MEKLHYQLIIPPGVGRIDSWLSTQLPYSRSRVKTLFKRGLITIQGSVIRPSFQAKGGEIIDIYVPPQAPTTIIPQALELDIQYMDDDIIVVNKPAGMVVHPAAGHPMGTLANGIVHLVQQHENTDPQRPGIVHRIDKGTSGLLVVARTDRALQCLTQQFAEHTIDRRYLALCWGTPNPTSATIDQPLGRHPKDRKKMAIVPTGKRAVTHFQSIKHGHFSGTGRAGAVTLLMCRLETGRTHQIRVHLSTRGHALVGDPVYRKSGVNSPMWRRVLEKLDHQLLHAWKLAFVHPNGQYLSFKVPPPSDYLTVLRKAHIEQIDW